jgi:4-hydroxy-tetrahydrodipicolinate synthase
LADRHGNVIGINSSHGDSAYLAAIVGALANRLEICVGGPGQAMTALGLGAHGFLCSEANLAPDLVASLVSHAASGDLAATLADFGRLARLSDLLYGNGGIRITKALLRALGLPGGHLRAPQVDPSPEAINRVRSAAVALAGLT